VVTKLWNADQGYDSTLAAFDASMKRLGSDFLQDWPNTGPGPELMAYSAR
jgi:2,5-diketo-D-gluconate reductase A